MKNAFTVPSCMVSVTVARGLSSPYWARSEVCSSTVFTAVTATARDATVRSSTVSTFSPVVFSRV